MNSERTHEQFLNKIKEMHPELTSKDLRLCAYLRMNLSSKEIAPLLRISVRGVENHRYRVRKKNETRTRRKINRFDFRALKRVKYFYRISSVFLGSFSRITIFALAFKYGCSSVGRALVSKTRCRAFESLLPCKRVVLLNSSFLLSAITTRLFDIT